jgi:hypothetical protein
MARTFELHDVSCRSCDHVGAAVRRPAAVALDYPPSPAAATSAFVPCSPRTSPSSPTRIQLAIAPVFLLTGIAALLGVMANRLARIIDRARHYEDVWEKLDEESRELAREELARSSNGAISPPGPSTSARPARSSSAP